MYYPFSTPKHEEQYRETVQSVYHGRHFGVPHSETTDTSSTFSPTPCTVMYNLCLVSL